ncbi:MAG TPA: hypothetical protein VFY91_08820, partial [Microbacterium sp.]|nr:hypothetical protein [Microbacterium sp.]
TFALDARNFAGAFDGYTTTVDEVETVGDSIAVSTTETYTSLFDAEGNQTDQPMEYADNYEYILVRAGDSWVINDVFME